MNLANKIVFVTGGSQGIGLAIAEALLDEGSRVVICGRNAERLAQAKAANPQLHTIRCDITQESELLVALAEIEAEYGGLDILVNNAGVQFNYRHPKESKTTNIISRIEQEIELNFTSVVKLTQHALPLLMRSREGAIVNVGSGTGLVPKPDGIVYSATKAAIHSFTKGLRWQLEETNVKVFELFPPVVETAMTAGRPGEKMQSSVVAQQLISGMKRDQTEITVGKIKLLRLINRLSPALAETIMRRQ